MIHDKKNSRIVFFFGRQEWPLTPLYIRLPGLRPHAVQHKTQISCASKYLHTRYIQWRMQYLHPPPESQRQYQYTRTVAQALVSSLRREHPLKLCCRGDMLFVRGADFTLALRRSPESFALRPQTVQVVHLDQATSAQSPAPTATSYGYDMYEERC